MVPNLNTVSDLRKMFLEGTTPSRLIAYIASRHAGDPSWPQYVQAYFSAAFHIVLLEWENRSPDLPVDDKMASFLNTSVLHEMVGRAHLWRHTIVDVAQGSAWLDGLDVSPDELKLIDGIHPERHPSLSASWPSLSDPVKEAIRRGMVNSQSYYEKTQILIRLVERLQKQLPPPAV